MSPIGPESFQRLEEFPSFPSCIKCFGRPIIPPLLTSSRRYELKQLRVAATNKEIELLRRKKDSLNQQTQDVHLIPSTAPKDFYGFGLQSDMQESCALWYPFLKDSQEGISVAISKFPTSDIYSSVHSGAIVCSNVIEDRHAYSSRILRDSLFGSETSVLGCIECSHNNIKLECNLCQAEYNQSFNDRNFAPEVSPEVPCRTFSLLQQNVGVMNDELNSTVEDTRCESLPTIMSNPKYIPTDTDSDATCMTQSTDLEKYMELSCEFSSPDCPAVVWDSKSTCQQYTLSRSDDASSETIVNTENELTPCASTMAEFTDNIEDELSNAEENAGSSDNKEKTPSLLKRAHSVDSYMKIIQTCARSLNVKKSLSEPFNTNSEITFNENETKISVSPKTNLLIKEDSKESDESKEIPERDVSLLDNNEEAFKYDKTADSETGDNNSFEKKHVRQNSYTLDHPSSALILAHADCTCNFDAKCISPHCSALKDKEEITPLSAFTKEKLDVDNPVSHHEMKKLPILRSESLPCNVTNAEHLTSSVVDVFPVVKEDSCEKSNSGNTSISKEALKSERILAVETHRNAKENAEVSSEKISENLNISEENKNPENFQHMLEKFREKEIQLERLIQEQKEFRLKLQEEFEEQKKLLHDQLNRSSISSTVLDSLTKVDKHGEAPESQGLSKREVTSVVDSVLLPPSPTPIDLVIQNPTLLVPHETPSSLKDHNLLQPQNLRASISPSSERNTSNHSPSRPLENIKDLHKESDVSVDCNIFQYNSDSMYSNISESLPNVNGYSCFETSTLLPHCNNLPSTSNAIVYSSDKKCDNLSACFCDKSPKQCECCSSYNGYCCYHISNSSPDDFSQDFDSNLGIQNLSSKVKSLHYSQNSSTSVLNKNLDTGDLASVQNSNNPKETCVSKQVTDSDYAAQNARLKNLELPSAAISSGDRKNILHQSSIEKTKLSVSNLSSKTSKKGSSYRQDLSINKKIVVEPMVLKKFEKLPAFVKGYLTRRLFKTERVQSLIKILQDTALLIGKLSEDLSMKGDSVSERDVDFHRQLIVQLMTTFHNVYDIFCTISTKERMNIIAESRSYRLQKVKSESEIPVTTKVPDPAPSKNRKLSSATLKALERKRRSIIDSRTYTLEDFKNLRTRSAMGTRTYTIEDLNGFRGRSHSSMSTKNLSVSPTSIYKTSVGLALKRKTANIKSSRTRQNLLHKWVP